MYLLEIENRLVILGVKTTIIHPATEKHIIKYSSQNCYMLDETPEIYNSIVVPHITSDKFNLQVSVEFKLFQDLFTREYSCTAWNRVYTFKFAPDRAIRIFRDTAISSIQLPRTKFRYSVNTRLCIFYGPMWTCQWHMPEIS